MNKYVIAKYIRLSIEDEKTESLSIPNQRKILDRHIDDLDIPNAEVIEFCDNGHTGTNMERPGVQRLIDLVRSGGVNLICVKDFSRFSRSALDSGYFIEQVFPLYGVRFVSVDDCFDGDDYKNDTGGIDVAFKFLMHEYYSIDLSKKVKSAKRIRMARGENIVKNAIYGYRKNDSGRWEPDDEAAAVVRKIYQMALNGLPAAVISGKLCEMKIPTPREYVEIKRGKSITPAFIWEARAVLRMLTNEQYIGSYVSGKQESKAIGSHSKIHTDKSDWIIIPDAHPAIVSKEVFAAVQKMLETRLKSATTAKPTRNILAEDENRQHRDKMISGERLPGNVIYGYVKTSDGGLAIDETAAIVIREIFTLAKQGLSADEIKDKMTADKHPTPSEYIRLAKGKSITPECRWTYKCVRVMLKNVQLTGAYVSGRIIKDYEKGKNFHTAKSDWIVIPGKYPAIISRELFDEVQKIITGSKTRRKNIHPRDYLLRGDILKCACCGRSLVYDLLAEPIFRCWHTVSDKTADCHKMKVKVREVDEAVLSIIKKQAEVILGYSDIGHLRQKTVCEQQISDYEKLIASCEEQRQRLYESFILREIDRDEYLKLKVECSDEIEHLNKIAMALRAEIQASQIDTKTIIIAKRAISGAIPRKELIDALIDKVRVFPDKRIEIAWKIQDFAKV